MNQKILFLGAVAAAIVAGALLFGGGGTGDGTQLAAAGAFDDRGYNRVTRAFQGTGESWCTAQGRAADCMGEYSQSALAFFWNAGWDKGNREAWANGPYDATMTVDFGATEFEISWVGTCADGTPTAKGTCVWGEFGISGTDAGPSKAWITQASPSRF